MTVLYSCKDRVPVQIGDMTFYFSPFSMAQKSALIQKMEQLSKSSPTEMLEASMEIVQLSLKAVKGITKPDGSEWSLSFDSDKVSKESMEDLMNLDCVENIFTVAGLFMRGVPANGKVIHPATGKEIEGVEVKKSM